MKLSLNFFSNLCSNEENSQFLVENKTFVSNLNKIYESKQKQDINETVMFCIFNLAKNVQNTTRIVEQGVLPNIVKSFQDHNISLEREYAAAALYHISEDGMVLNL